MPQKHIRKRFVINRSKPSKPRSKIIAYEQGVSVASIARTPASGKRGRAAGKLYGSAFFNSAPQGGVLAYQRKGRARNPIEVVKVDIKDSVDRVLPKVSQRVMSKEFPLLVRRELIYRINKRVSR